MRICFLYNAFAPTGFDISISLIKEYLSKIPYGPEVFSLVTCLDSSRIRLYSGARLIEERAYDSEEQYAALLGAMIEGGCFDMIDLAYNDLSLPVYDALADSSPDLHFVLRFHMLPSAETLSRAKEKILGLMEKMSGIITVSEYLRKELERIFPEAEALPAAAVIANGLEPDRFHAEEPAFGRQLTVLFCGRLEKVKSLPLLMWAFSCCAQEMPGSRLVIAGTGREEAHLKNLAARLGISGITDWAGQVPYAEIPEYYRDCSFYASAASGEPFGRPLIEAMASGRPVAALASGAAPEIIEDGSTGILCPRDGHALAGAMKTLAKDPGLRAAMGRRALREARAKYRIEDIAGTYRDYYEHILSIRKR